MKAHIKNVKQLSDGDIDFEVFKVLFKIRMVAFKPCGNA
jgi:hypothetical protein